MPINVLHFQLQLEMNTVFKFKKMFNFQSVQSLKSVERGTERIEDFLSSPQKVYSPQKPSPGKRLKADKHRG